MATSRRWDADVARRTGRSAETRFATMCAEAGAICNEPKEDESGWDFIVGLPRSRLDSLSADMQPPHPPVLVQIKSHEGKSRRITLKLSNALIFAHSPLPCFLVLMILPPQGEPKIYALHFWETLIARAFKRAREAARDGVPDNELNRSTLTITVTEDDRHDHNLIEWMEAVVGGAGRDYAAFKRHLQDTVGFEKGQIGGILQVGPLVSIEELVNHQLGLTSSIPMAKVTLQSRRFGIAMDLPLPDWPVTHARLTANPVDQCIIRLRGPTGEEIALDAEMIVPAVPVPDAQFKARIRSPIVDVIWAPSGESRIDGHINTGTLMSPDLLYKMARMAGWAGQGMIDIRVDTHDQRLLASEARLNGFDDAEQWSHLADLIEPIAAIAAVRIREPALISIEQLLDSSRLDAFFRFVTQIDMVADFVFADGASPPSADHAVLFALLQVGDWVFGTLVRQAFVEQSFREQRWTVRLGKPDQLERYAFRADDPSGMLALEAEYRHHSKRSGAIGLDNALIRIHDASSSTA